ncbi:hypothetical protein L6452_21894 [Arctium lappa]|uniref:Uncharacterized protein n=1 Tax=Arctium lappa TaxID=4217 RepID=A0ACB9AXP6_ARCLA|nr:hypothetical protein L6452_21894 [Arctium lappa]
MCVHDAVKDNLGLSPDDTTAQLASNQITLSTSFPMDSIGETAVVTYEKPNEFIPVLRSGEWSDIGKRAYMEDTHICIPNLAENFSEKLLSKETVSFYGVFDGHGGKGASHFVRDHLPRIIVEDANFPLELEKVVMRSFMETDAAFAKSCSMERSLSSGTTALTAMIFGRSLLVANAGDCRAVLSRNGLAFVMSKDHRPCCHKERIRVESLGLKESGDQVGPLSAEPELKLVTLTQEDEFLIIGSDGIWDVFRNQNAVDFIRRRLQDHNDVKRCCKEMVEEAMKRGAIDNLTVVVVCFQAEPPSPVVVQRGRVQRSISAEGLLNLKFHLEG